MKIYEWVVLSLVRLTLVGVSNGAGICVRGKYVECTAVSKQYLNIFSKDGDNGGALDMVNKKDFYYFGFNCG